MTEHITEGIAARKWSHHQPPISFPVLCLWRMRPAPRFLLITEHQSRPSPFIKQSPCCAINHSSLKSGQDTEPPSAVIHDSMTHELWAQPGYMQIPRPLEQESHHFPMSHHLFMDMGSVSHYNLGSHVTKKDIAHCNKSTLPRAHNLEEKTETWHLIQFNYIFELLISLSCNFWWESTHHQYF